MYKWVNQHMFFHYTYVYAYMWNEFRFLLDHVNYRTKQSNSMASYSDSGESLDTVVIPCITCKSVALD